MCAPEKLVRACSKTRAQSGPREGGRVCQCSLVTTQQTCPPSGRAKLFALLVCLQRNRACRPLVLPLMKNHHYFSFIPPFITLWSLRLHPLCWKAAILPFCCARTALPPLPLLLCRTKRNLWGGEAGRSVNGDMERVIDVPQRWELQVARTVRKKHKCFLFSTMH